VSNGTTSPCPCAECQDPRVVDNPPGLPEISDRVDDFTGFRRALLRPLPGEQAIGNWRPAPGDLGLQVLEWWAYLADVLTFYNERIANESYLRTAVQASSVANLVALLGYEPAPGIGASGVVAALRSSAHPAEPLVVPEGARLSSTSTPGVPSQTFEVSTTASFAGPSTVAVTLAPDTTLPMTSEGGPASVLVAGKVSGVQEGDRLLVAARSFDGTIDQWSLVTVGSLTPTPDPGTGATNTLVTFSSGSWGPTGPATSGEVVVTELGLHAFPEYLYWYPGIEAADAEPSAQVTDYVLLAPTASASLWNQPNGPSSQQPVQPPEGTTPLTLHLAAAVRGISPGDMVLVEGGAASAPAPAMSALGVVAGVTEQLWVVPYPGPTPPTADIAVSHSALALTLTENAAGALERVADPTTVVLRYAFRDVGTLIGTPTSQLTALPATLDVPDTYAPPPGGATAFLVDSTGAGVLVEVTGAGNGQVTVGGAGTPPSMIDTPLQVPLQLLVDPVAVSRGTTVTNEVLGSGNAALINQSFTLAKSPLTYFLDGDTPVSTLAVYVDGIEWQEVPSFYGQPAEAPVFVVSRSPDQSVTTVTFGDGVNGARLSSGGNVAASYRYGSGAASPPAGRLTTIVQPQVNLSSMQNPVAVSGGADPQSPADVRNDAPASVLAFGRAISEVDYEVVASQAPGVSRVRAVWTFDKDEQRTLVVLYVGDDTAAVQAAAAALAGAEDPNRPVSVVAATPFELFLSCTLVVAAGRPVDDVVAAATAALVDPSTGLFRPATMGVGQRLYRSMVDGALSVPGLAAVHHLEVIRPVAVGGLFLFELLEEAFDPGEGSFFDLVSDNVKIVGVPADG